MASKIPSRVAFFTNVQRTYYDVDDVYLIEIGNVDAQSTMDTARRNTTYSGHTPTIFTYENSHFNNVQVIGASCINNGGLVYHLVLHHDNKRFAVEATDESMFDIMKRHSIDHGFLIGDFAFVQQNGPIRLVATDSDIYRNAQHDETRRNSHIIGKNELQTGHIYRNLKGDTALFLGYVYARAVKNETYTTHKLSYSDPVAQLMFLELYKKTAVSYGYLIECTDSTYYFRLKLSSSYREDLGEAFENVNLTEITTRLRETARKCLMEENRFYKDNFPFLTIYDEYAEDFNPEYETKINDILAEMQARERRYYH
jgi:hypothetical protein